jgi:hypothetical protein
LARPAAANGEIVLPWWQGSVFFNCFTTTKIGFPDWAGGPKTTQTGVEATDIGVRRAKEPFAFALTVNAPVFTKFSVDWQFSIGCAGAGMSAHGEFGP